MCVLPLAWASLCVTSGQGHPLPLILSPRRVVQGIAHDLSGSYIQVTVPEAGGYAVVVFEE